MKTQVLHLFERLALVVRSSATISAGIYLLKVINRNIRTRCDWFLYGRRSGLFIMNFEHLSCFILVFLL